MLWMFADTPGARRCSGCLPILRVLDDALDVCRYSGCSPMFADALDVRRCARQHYGPKDVARI